MKRHILFAVIIAFTISNAASSAVAFDRNASGTTTNNFTFGITCLSSTHQPTLATTLNIASIKYGNGIFTVKNLLIITAGRLTVYRIIQNINTPRYNLTFFHPLPDSGITDVSKIPTITRHHGERDTPQYYQSQFIQ